DGAHAVVSGRRPEPPPAPGSAAAPVAPSALIAQPAPAAAAAGDEDHRYGWIVLAAAVLIIAGPVLGISRLLSVMIIRAERRCALSASAAPAPGNRAADGAGRARADTRDGRE